MTNAVKKKVLIIQPILAHYRTSLFFQLTASKEFDVHIIAGKQIGNIKEIKTVSSQILSNLANKKWRFRGHNFIWQKGAVNYALKLKPDVIVLTGVDPHLMSNLYLAMLSKILGKSKIIWWGHASVDQQGKMGKLFRKFFFNMGNGIFTYNEIGKRKLESVVNPRITISVIKNSINTEEYGFNHCLKQVIEGKELTILFSGRITNEKRLDILLDAMCILKKKSFSAHCLVIGDGPERAAAEQQVLKNELENMVTFLGERYLEECVPYFKTADIFVLPGKVGLSIIHGLSYGLPVITSDKKEIHSPEFEIIRQGINGDFFHEFDPASLADKIIEWGDKIGSNKKLITGNCINSIIEEGYTPEIMANKMLDLFTKLTTGKAQREHPISV